MVMTVVYSIDRRVNKKPRFDNQTLKIEVKENEKNSFPPFNRRGKFEAELNRDSPDASTEKDGQDVCDDERIKNLLGEERPFANPCKAH